MVKLLKFLSYSLLFIIALIYFIPKISIYYFLETELKKFDTIVSKEELIDTGYSLKVKDATISLKSVDTAKISELDAKLFIVYNMINVNNIYLSSVASTYVPLKIENLKILYTVINPINLEAKAYGEFGEIYARVNLLESTLYVRLTPSKLMLKKYQRTLKMFKKSKKGLYIYEKNI